MHPLLGELDPETGEPAATIEREAVIEAENDLIPEIVKSRAAHQVADEREPPTTRFDGTRFAGYREPPKSYCESCGGVDQHMEGCPALLPPPEERVADFTRHEPEPSLMRQALGWALKRIAKKLLE
jgi:hypothetical protein